MSGPLFLFAHGAGAGSSSEWMQGWTRRLSRIGTVTCFDYPYITRSRRTPDRFPVLLEAHRENLARARRSHAGPVFLIGKSMGSRIGCHLSTQESVDGVICFGYPLVGVGRTAARRDQILWEMKTPVLFIQGTRDRLCPLNLLTDVRKEMHAQNDLYVVEAGDHSLIVTKTWLKANDTSQELIDKSIAERVAQFVRARSSG